MTFTSLLSQYAFAPAKLLRMRIYKSDASDFSEAKHQLIIKFHIVSSVIGSNSLLVI